MCIGAQGAIDVGPGKFFSIWGRDIYLYNGCLVASLHYVVDAKGSYQSSLPELSCQAARPRTKLHCERGGRFCCFSSGGQKSS